MDPVRQCIDESRAALARGDAAGALQAVTCALQLMGRAEEAASLREQVKSALVAGDASAYAASQLAALFQTAMSLQIQVQVQGAAAASGAAEASGAWTQQLAQPQAQHLAAAQQHMGAAATPPAAPGSQGTEDAMDMEVGEGFAGRPLEALVAAAEGATYVCQRCGGAVSVARREAHEQLWCSALGTG